MSTVSANMPPTMGIKLSMAYLAVRMLTPSTAAALRPCTDITPMKTVKPKPSVQLAICRTSRQRRLSRTLSPSPPAMVRTATPTAKGMVTCWISVVMEPAAAITAGW